MQSVSVAQVESKSDCDFLKGAVHVPNKTLGHCDEAASECGKRLPKQYEERKPCTPRGGGGLASDTAHPNSLSIDGHRSCTIRMSGPYVMIERRGKTSAYPVEHSHWFISATDLNLIEEGLGPIASFMGTWCYNEKLVSLNSSLACPSIYCSLHGRIAFTYFRSCLYWPKHPCRLIRRPRLSSSSPFYRKLPYGSRTDRDMFDIRGDFVLQDFHHRQGHGKL